jgi:hypothetical protein
MSIPTPEPGLLSVEVGDLTWPESAEFAIVQRATGDPWRDLNGFKRANALAKENEVPMFIVGELRFPTPEEQQAAKPDA